MIPLLMLRDVSKRFRENGVLAVDRASLSIEGGTVAAIVGENGAGKSTLMHIVAGTVARDSGTLEFAGREFDPQHHGAADHGIVMSFQQPRLDPDLTVLENLFLGDEPRRWRLFFDHARARARVSTVAPDFDTALLSRKLSTLSSGQRRIVSLVGALLRLPESPGVLILDEPTEATTPTESERVFEIVHRAASHGHAVVLITHKLHEVTQAADTAFLMRAGRIVDEFRQPLSIDRLAEELGGRQEDEKTEEVPVDGHRQPQAPDALVLERVSVIDHGRSRLHNVSIRLAPGEIVGCVGVRENGLEALEDVIAGWLLPSSGRMAVAGHWCEAHSIGRRIRKLRHEGLGYVPTARFERGASLDATLAENLIARARGCLQRSGIFVDEWTSRQTDASLQRLGIDGRADAPLRHLSGGNIQKSILAREVTPHSPLLLICEPGWGLDIATRARLKTELLSAARSGSGILVISTDVDEVLEFCDRVIVFANGEIVAEKRTTETTRSAVAGLLGSSLPSDPLRNAGAHGG